MWKNPTNQEKEDFSFGRCFTSLEVYEKESAEF